MNPRLFRSSLVFLCWLLLIMKMSVLSTNLRELHLFYGLTSILIGIEGKAKHWDWGKSEVGDPILGWNHSIMKLLCRSSTAGNATALGFPFCHCSLHLDPLICQEKWRDTWLEREEFGQLWVPDHNVTKYLALFSSRSLLNCYDPAESCTKLLRKQGTFSLELL